MNSKRILLPIMIAAAGLLWLFSTAATVEAQVDGEQETGGLVTAVNGVANGGTVSCVIAGDSSSVNCAGTVPAGTDYLRIDLNIAPDADPSWLVRGFALDITGTQSSNTRLHLLPGITDFITDAPTWINPLPDGFTRYCWQRYSLIVGGCNRATPDTTGLVEYNQEFSGDYDRLYIYLARGASNTIDLTFTPKWIMLDNSTTTTTTTTAEQTLGVFPCVVTYTETITNDSGITTTQTITYTVPDANLVKNSSFEDLTYVNTSAYPEIWEPVKNGVVDYSTGDIISLLARTGDSGVYSREQYELWGDLNRTIPTGDYRLGYYVACSVDLECNYDLATLSVGTRTPTGTHVFSVTGTTFTSYSDTVSLGGGSPNVVIDFVSGGPPYTVVDDVFLYPVDESGAISCSAELYPPDEFYTDPIGSIPGPIGAAGAVCYACTTPNNLAATTVSYWIAWLGCVIRNMFSCSLRVWLLIIGNWISGLINQGVAWIAWVPVTVYQAADWFNKYVLPAISSISLNIINTEAQTNGWDVLIALIDLLSTIVAALSNILLGIVNFFGDLITLIPNVINAEPRYLTLDGTEYSGSGAIDVSGEGGSNNKAVFLFFMGIQWVDAILFANDSVVMMLYVVMGLATFLVLWWSAQYWSELISL